MVKVAREKNEIGESRVSDYLHGTHDATKR